VPHADDYKADGDGDDAVVRRSRPAPGGFLGTGPAAVARCERSPRVTAARCLPSLPSALPSFGLEPRTYGPLLARPRGGAPRVGRVSLRRSERRRSERERVSSCTPPLTPRRQHKSGRSPSS
jgi:hypothetical protein